MAKSTKTEIAINHSDLTDEQVTYLYDAGLKPIQIYNFLKKHLTFEDMKKKMGAKVEENQAKIWLANRLYAYWNTIGGLDAKEIKKNIREYKIPVRKLTKLSAKELKSWTLRNPQQTLTLTLPLLPSENHMYQSSFSTGAKQMTMHTKMLFMQIQDVVIDEVIKQDWQSTYKTQVVANMKFYFPDDKRRDCHNMFKFLFDTFNGIAMDDDRYLLPRVWNIIIDKGNPRIEICLAILSDSREVQWTDNLQLQPN